MSKVFLKNEFHLLNSCAEEMEVGAPSHRLSPKEAVNFDADRKTAVVNLGAGAVSVSSCPFDVGGVAALGGKGAYLLFRDKYNPTTPIDRDVVALRIHSHAAIHCIRRILDKVAADLCAIGIKDDGEGCQ